MLRACGAPWLLSVSITRMANGASAANAPKVSHVLSVEKLSTAMTSNRLHGSVCSARAAITPGSRPTRL